MEKYQNKIREFYSLAESVFQRAPKINSIRLYTSFEEYGDGYHVYARDKIEFFGEYTEEELDEIPFVRKLERQIPEYNLLPNMTHSHDEQDAFIIIHKDRKIDGFIEASDNLPQVSFHHSIDQTPDINITWKLHIPVKEHYSNHDRASFLLSPEEKTLSAALKSLKKHNLVYHAMLEIWIESNQDNHKYCAHYQNHEFIIEIPDFPAFFQSSSYRLNN